MTTQKPWSNAERESLYHTAIDHIHELVGSGELYLNDDVIEAIQEVHQEYGRDNRAILLRLCKMGFLRQRGQKAYRSPIEALNIHQYGVHPDYKTLTQDEEKALQTILQAEWNCQSSLESITRSICEKLGISDTHAHCHLFKEGIAILQNPEMAEDEAPRYALAVNPNERVKPATRLKRIPDAVRSHINSLRAKVSGLYDSYATQNPAIVYSNDGTGTGKSYSVIDQYVEHTHPDNTGAGHRNLVFITPQKAQIKFDKSTIQKAEVKGIPFVGLYSRLDFSDLDFRHWVTGVRTEDLFQSWVKALSGVSAYAESLLLLDSSVKHLKHCNAQITRLEKEGDLINLKRIEEDQERMKSNIHKATRDMATIALNDPKVDPARGANHYYQSNDARDKVIASILDHYAPLERAKFMPCILMATTKKFITTTPVARRSKNGFSFSNQPFDYVVGKKLDLRSEDGVKEANGKPFGEQVDFIRNEFFQFDEDNHFLQHNIAFTIIIDEEHIAHDQILDDKHSTLFDKDIRIAHVFAAVYRIMNRAKHTDPANPSGLVLEKACQDFHDEVMHLFSTKCQSTFSIDHIITMFKDNFGDMLIDGKDVEQVVNICKNVFSVTPKRFFNENGLKKIRVKSFAGDSECRIYYDDDVDGDDPNPTMHDVMQAILCIFAACAKIEDSKLITFLGYNRDNSQNSLLSNFINTARRNRGCIESMFSRVDDEEILINEFFTYFTPKIVFSLEKIDDIPLPPSALENAIYVGFKVELFEELPEVSVMRMLHGTDNTMITLSATSGFYGSFSGNYARPVLAKFGHSHTPENLGFNSVSRLLTDTKALTTLREARNELRSVAIHTFQDGDRSGVSKAQRGQVFDECLAVWRKPLQAAMFGKNKYRVRELNRQVETLLMCAWDAKNTLALALSNDFSQTFREYLKGTTVPLGRFRPLRSDNKIFEIQPFDNGVTVRVILFDSDLNKDCVIDDFMTADEHTKIAFFSSYRTAGTGLNLFLKDKAEDLDEDFERLVLINSPFYSTVKTPQGLNTAINHILALKHYASNSQALTLAEFDKLLRSPEVKRLLMDEHYLSVLKDIMQAIGRIERRDTYTGTEIYLPDSLVEDISLQFSRVNTPANAMLINSMSLLNTHLMEYCIREMASQSFANDQERDDFSHRITNASKQIDYFLGSFLRKQVLAAARKGDRQAAELNEMLRSMDCIENPARFVERIKKHPLVQKNPVFSTIIDGFYIQMPEAQKHVKLCWARGMKRGLTDFAAGSQVYRPYDMVIPEYTNLLSFDKHDTPSMVINRLWDTNREASAMALPNPELLPLIKGNVGEHMFKQFLGQIGVTAMSLDTLFTTFEPQAYELFDEYVLNGNNLLCIDVKNWGSQLEDSDLSEELVAKAIGKRQTLIELCDRHGYTPRFVYVNTHYDLNARNTEQEFSKGEPIHYMNLFKVGSRYRASKKNNQISKVNEVMEFNPSLVSLFAK